jgi:large subunit ribosomal protein L2
LEYHRGVRSYVAAVVYTCGVASYILAPQGLRPGNVIMSGPLSKPALGCSLLLKDMPFNIKIHNIESLPRSGGKYARSAGTWARVVEREQN